MNDQDSKKINEALLVKMTQMDRTTYGSLTEYQNDVNNPLYETNEAYREAVDARLGASKHLWAGETPHIVTDFRGGEDAVGLRYNMETGVAKLSHPGSIGDVAPAPENRSHEPRLEDTGNALILHFSTEGGSEEGESE